MEYRELGKTGLKVSRLGLGGIPLQRIDEGETKKIIQSLLDIGHGGLIALDFVQVGNHLVHSFFAACK